VGGTAISDGVLFLCLMMGVAGLTLTVVIVVVNDILFLLVIFPCSSTVYLPPMLMFTLHGRKYIRRQSFSSLKMTKREQKLVLVWSCDD